jgi:hypothetical protein
MMTSPASGESVRGAGTQKITAETASQVDSTAARRCLDRLPNEVSGVFAASLSPRPATPVPQVKFLDGPSDPHKSAALAHRLGLRSVRRC